VLRLGNEPALSGKYVVSSSKTGVFNAGSTNPERTTAHALVLPNALHGDRNVPKEFHLLLEPDDILLESTDITTPLIM
jgi:hypothetical protein